MNDKDGVIDLSEFRSAFLYDNSEVYILDTVCIGSDLGW